MNELLFGGVGGELSRQLLPTMLCSGSVEWKPGPGNERLVSGKVHTCLLNTEKNGLHLDGKCSRPLWAVIFVSIQHFVQLVPDITQDS